MSTTTIRLSDRLKARVARAAERAGTSSHSFILEAIAEKADQQERRDDFHDTADRRYTEIVKSGKAVAWSDVRGYLEKRLADKQAVRPAPRKLAR